jgi:hypothetical protein
LAITKDTAARAIATLRSAGLILPTRIQVTDSPTRTGYQLNLPNGLTLTHEGPAKEDGVRSDERASPSAGYHTPPLPFSVTRPSEPTRQPPGSPRPDGPSPGVGCV